jgi:hypothetical protein
MTATQSVSDPESVQLAAKPTSMAIRSSMT